MNYFSTTIRDLIATFILILVFQRYEVNCNELELLDELLKLGEVDASSYLKEVFENIKQEEAEKLDPIILNDKIDEHFVKKDKIDVNVVIYPGFKIEGMSKSVLRNFSSIFNFDELTLNVGAEIFLPELKGTGTYAMNGKTFKYFPVRGNGQVLIVLKDIAGNGSVVANFNGEHFEAERIDFNLYPLQIKLHFDNLINSNLSHFFNTLLNFLAKPLFDKLLINNERLMGDIKIKLLDEINKQLAMYNTSTLLNDFRHS